MQLITQDDNDQAMVIAELINGELDRNITDLEENWAADGFNLTIALYGFYTCNPQLSGISTLENTMEDWGRRLESLFNQHQTSDEIYSPDFYMFDFKVD